MLNLNSVMVGTQNPEKMVKFYNEVFGKKPDMEESGWAGWMAGSSFFSIGAHDQVKGNSTQPERVIFNFETPNVKEEFERIKAIDGVVVVKEPYQMGEQKDFLIATFADPDGNYFQLMSPWEGK